MRTGGDSFGNLLVFGVGAASAFGLGHAVSRFFHAQREDRERMIARLSEGDPGAAIRKYKREGFATVADGETWKLVGHSGN